VRTAIIPTTIRLLHAFATLKSLSKNKTKQRKTEKQKNKKTKKKKKKTKQKQNKNKTKTKKNMCCVVRNYRISNELFIESPATLHQLQ
jgi:hypothetical protein